MPRLVYYPDDRPGIRRRRHGRGFTFVAADGTRVEHGPERDRLIALAVPPAYERVWLSPLPNGHLQATGFDGRSRKQYRYHPDWSQARAETKFDSLADFGRSLPAIRRRVAADLKADAGDREFALAAAVALIDKLALRVGCEAYTKMNGSYGAVTLRRNHLRLAGDEIRLSYTAKGGRKVRRKLSDKKLITALEKARDLPGATLLSWIDEGGETRTLSSSALNAYIAEAGGTEGITAKTFRTWTGTLAAFEAAVASKDPTIAAMADAAAGRLHNTPAISRKSYIHPAVISLSEGMVEIPRPVRLKGLAGAEAQLLGFLEAQK